MLTWVEVQNVEAKIMFAPATGITVDTAISTPVEILPPEDLMDRDEAEKLCQEIEFQHQKIQGLRAEIAGHVDHIRGRLLALRDRQGFRSLGYESMKQLCDDRFDRGKSQFYREIEAGEVEQSIGLPFGSLKTSQALELKPLPPSDRKAVLEAVQYSGRPTAANLQAAVADKLDTEPGMPSREAIFDLYGLYGRVVPTPSRKQRNAFKVLREHPQSPDELYFDGLKKAWHHWNDDEFHRKVEEAIAQYGEYQTSIIPKSCLTCAQRDLKHVGAGEDEIYCYKKRTAVGSDRWLTMAESGCWTGSDGSEADESRAELDRTEGPVVVFQQGGVNVEAIALTVKVKYIKHGAVAYREVPIDQLLGGFKLES